jgi:hypothetical protein
MKYLISENKLSNVLLKYLNLSFDGFDNLDYNWADFNCGWVFYYNKVFIIKTIL